MRTIKQSVFHYVYVAYWVFAAYEALSYSMGILLHLNHLLLIHYLNSWERFIIKAQSNCSEQIRNQERM